MSWPSAAQPPQDHVGPLRVGDRLDGRPGCRAWSDYWGCILELEIHRFARDGAEATQYGRRWVSVFLRGVERMSVAIERTVEADASRVRRRARTSGRPGNGVTTVTSGARRVPPWLCPACLYPRRPPGEGDMLGRGGLRLPQAEDDVPAARFTMGPPASPPQDVPVSRYGEPRADWISYLGSLERSPSSHALLRPAEAATFSPPTAVQ